MPAKKPRRGPYCGANTPMPEPSLIWYIRSNTLTTSNRSVVGFNVVPGHLNSCEMPRLYWSYHGSDSVLAKPLRKPLPKIMSAEKRVPFQRYDAPAEPDTSCA